LPMSDHPGRGLRAVLDAAGAPAAVKAGGHLTRLCPSRLTSSPGQAIGLMLTLAAIGGFFIPIIFGHLVPHTSYGAGWIFLAAVSAALALVAVKGGNPVTVGSS
jgi:nitrate/nitrite transporter NarK